MILKSQRNILMQNLALENTTSIIYHLLCIIGFLFVVNFDLPFDTLGPSQHTAKGRPCHPCKSQPGQFL